MKDYLPNREQIEAAASIVARELPATPQIRWPLLCQRLGVETWVKHENHLPTGAFKVRGGLTLLHDLAQSNGGDSLHFVSATRGNHGQSLAYASKLYGAKATIVVPHGNSREKNAAMRALGAELVEYGEDFTEADAHATQLASEHQLRRVPSVHPLLVRGVASYWMEFFQRAPELDTVYVPIGLGSGICAGIAVRDALNLRTQIIGVTAANAPAYAASFEAGTARSLPLTLTRTIADGVAVREPNVQALEVILKGAERVVRVSEEEIKAAMKAYFTDTHNVAEGAGASPLAAVSQERERLKGKTVGIVLTGSNVDHDVFVSILSSNNEGFGGAGE